MSRHLLLLLTILLLPSPAVSEEVSEFKYASDSIVLDFQYPVATLTIAASGKVWGFVREAGPGVIPQRLDCAGHFKTVFLPQEIDELLSELEEISLEKIQRNAFLQSPEAMSKETDFGVTDTFPATISFHLADYKPKGGAWQGPIRKTFELRYLLPADSKYLYFKDYPVHRTLSAVGRMLVKRVLALACEVRDKAETDS